MGWQRVEHDWATFTFFTLQRQRASWVSRVGHVLVTEQQQQQQHMFSSVQLLSHVSLRPQESQHARPPCPWPTPGVYSNSCPSKSVMPSSHLILCHPLLLLPPIPPSIRVFSNESTLCMRWPKYWEFELHIYIHIWTTCVYVYICEEQFLALTSERITISLLNSIDSRLKKFWGTIHL